MKYSGADHALTSDGVGGAWPNDISSCQKNQLKRQAAYCRLKIH